MFDESLLDILVAPQSGAKLYFCSKQQELWSLADKLAFPIQDGIPVLLIEAARPLSLEEIDSFKKGTI